MRISLRVLTLAIIFGIANLSVAQETDSWVKEFDKQAMAFQKKHNPPGFTVAVAHNNKMIFEKAYGKSDLENDVATKVNSVFRTASIAKPITAIAVLQLVEQGKIKLDDPIQKHCPEFPETDQKLTIRHLLCHQGGIRHYKFAMEASGKKTYVSIADSIRLFKDDKLVAKPGEKYSYTTYGFSLLGRAVETASKKSFRDYLQDHIFNPAEMKNSGIDDYFRIIPNRSRGYAKLTPYLRRQLPKSVLPKLKAGQILNCELHDTSMKIPGGGLVSTSGDLVRFCLGVKNGKLIKPETRKLAWESQKTADGKRTNYGLGFGVRNQGKIIAHSGGQAGTSTFMMILPEDNLVVAVMCNLQRTPCAQLAQSIYGVVRDSAQKKK